MNSNLKSDPLTLSSSTVENERDRKIGENDHYQEDASGFLSSYEAASSIIASAKKLLDDTSEHSPNILPPDGKKKNQLQQQHDTKRKELKSENRSRPSTKNGLKKGTPNKTERRLQENNSTRHKTETFAESIQRKIEIQKFQKEIDELTVNIDTKLRSLNSINGVELDKEYGISRQVNFGTSPLMRNMEERAMRSQALLSLEHYMTSLSNRKLTNELDATNAWISGQASKLRNELESFGIEFNNTRFPVSAPDFDDLMDIPYAPETVDDDVDLANDPTLSSDKNSSRAATASTESDRPSDIIQSSLFVGLIDKLKQSKEMWQVSSKTTVEELKKNLDKKHQELAKQLRSLEVQITKLHRESVALDEKLQGSNEDKIRKGVTERFQEIQSRYEINIQKQLNRIESLRNEINQDKQEEIYLESTIHAAQQMKETGSEVPVGYLMGGDSIEQESHNYISLNKLSLLEHFIEKSKHFVSNLEGQYDTKSNALNDLLLLIDDSRDQVKVLQSKSKVTQNEIENIKLQQSAEIMSLKLQVTNLTTQATSIQAALKELELKKAAQLKSQKAKERNSVRLTTLMSTTRMSSRAGQEFLAKAKLAREKAELSKNGDLASDELSDSSKKVRKSKIVVNKHKKSTSDSLPTSMEAISPDASIVREQRSSQILPERLWPNPLGSIEEGEQDIDDSTTPTFPIDQQSVIEEIPHPTFPMQPPAEGSAEPSRKIVVQKIIVENGPELPKPDAFLQEINEEEEIEEHEDEEDEDEEEDEFAEEEDLEEPDYVPTSLSNISLGSYIHFFKNLDHSKAISRRGTSQRYTGHSAKSANHTTSRHTGNHSTPKRGISDLSDDFVTNYPSFTMDEGLFVLESIIRLLVKCKCIEPAFVEEIEDKLFTFKRELPILQVLESECVMVEICCSIINQVMQTAPMSLMAQNKHRMLRHALIAIYGLLGIIFNCCLDFCDEFIDCSKISPNLFQYIDEYSVDLVSNHLEIYEDIAVSNNWSYPLRPKKILSSLEDFLRKHRTLLWHGDIPYYVDETLAWIDKISRLEFKDSMAEIWKGSSLLHGEVKAPLVCSEDRHKLFTFQLMFYTIGFLDPQEEMLNAANKSIHYNEALDESILVGNNFGICKERILGRIGLNDMKRFGNIHDILFRVAPCAHPLLLTLELIRLIMEEEIKQKDFLDTLASGEDETLAGLQFLAPKFEPVLGEKREMENSAAFLELSQNEKEMLLMDKEKFLKLVKSITQLIDPSTKKDKQTGYCINITKKQRKALENHLEKLKEVCIGSKFGKNNHDVVIKIIADFDLHSKEIDQARFNEFDMEGEIMKPFKEKLRLLNARVQRLIDDHEKNVDTVATMNQEISEIEEVIEILTTSKSKMEAGQMPVVSPELETVLIVLDCAGGVDAQASRDLSIQKFERQTISLSNSIKNTKKKYNSIVEQIELVGKYVNYSSEDAIRQGAFFLSQILRTLLQTCDHGDSINALMLRKDKDMDRFGIYFGNVIKLILEFLGTRDMLIVGCMLLDDHISMCMSEELQVDQKRPLTVIKVEEGADKKMLPKFLTKGPAHMDSSISISSYSTSTSNSSSQYIKYRSRISDFSRLIPLQPRKPPTTVIELKQRQSKIDSNVTMAIVSSGGKASAIFGADFKPMITAENKGVSASRFPSIISRRSTQRSSILKNQHK